MKHTLFLHSDVRDPYTGYQVMLAENPVYWDEANRLWAIYAYETCKALLHNNDAQIPSINLNTNEHLTFGSGGHHCIASHFAVNLAVESLYYLFNRYSSVQLMEQSIAYEPLANVRLPKSLLISFS